MIAELENDIRRERQMDGIARAKAVGVHFLERTGLSKASVYRALGGDR
jgi:DNA invertase Pin-like site-specific DNA recombinase